MQSIPALHLLPASRFESPEILKKLASTSRVLAELKGTAGTIPRQSILINTLSIQEAKDSSEIENIVTTHDELFQGDQSDEATLNPAAKEVLRYRQALWTGFKAVQETRLLTLNHLLQIQAELEENQAGFRKLPGTSLKDAAGRTVYTPPQDANEIAALMHDLERFINDDALFDADPLIKMALIHHQFESIHPFYDGNGRTGRIINVLYLVKAGLLDIPVLYLSRHIVQTKGDYYRLLQTVREQDTWEEWVLYILTAVEATAGQSIAAILAIKTALMDYKHRIRSEFKFYSQDLINNLFTHPYTKIEFLQRDLGVSRLTATKYLEALTAAGLLQKRKIGRWNYFINPALTSILTGEMTLS
jgi:Fic family protein